jgi:hypothetical protein
MATLIVHPDGQLRAVATVARRTGVPASARADAAALSNNSPSIGQAALVEVTAHLVGVSESGTVPTITRVSAQVYPPSKVSDLAEIGRASIGHEYGLTPEQSKRLRGESADEVRADAKEMRHELGLAPLDDDEHDDRARDEHGRFAKSSGMNAIIRQASGRR